MSVCTALEQRGIAIVRRLWYNAYKEGGNDMLYVGCHLSASAGNLAMVETAVSLGYIV